MTGCERTRLSFVDLLDGTADARAAQHLSECPDCTRQLETLREAVASIEGMGQHDVPDPGQGYWDSFLPSIHARRTRRRSRALGIAASAAAVILLAVTFLLFVGPKENPSQLELAGATERLDRAFEADDLEPEVLLDAVEATELPLIEVAALMPGVAEEIEPALLIDALDAFNPLESSEATGWGSSEIWLRIDLLDDEQAALFRTSLAGEPC